MESTKFSFSTRDFLRGLLMAIGAPVITIIIQSVNTGELVFNWKAILTTAISAAGMYLLKNFFTDDTKVAEKVANDQGMKIVPKKLSDQKLPLILAMVMLSLCGTAQNFVKPIYLQAPIQQKTLIARTIVTPKDSTFDALRPIASAMTIYTGGTVKAAASAGVSYQNITYTYTTADKPGRAYCNYALSLQAAFGASVVPDKPAGATSFVLMVHALNNTVGAGFAYTQMDGINGQVWKPGVAISWSFNFNN